MAMTLQSPTATDVYEGVARTIVVIADARPYLLVMLAAEKLDMQDLGARLGLGRALVQLATSADLAEYFPDCESDAIPPFGNRYGMPVYLDVALTSCETLVFQAGTSAETRIEAREFKRLVHPRLFRARM
jgi:Ala-tRNA(Pro) deacylase